jgi:hypothetical protein
METGLGSDCRQLYNYVKISALSGVDRNEAHLLIHGIAKGELLGQALRGGIFRLYELGFTDLSKRIEQRVWRKVVQVEIATTEAAVPAAPEPPRVKPPLPFTLTDGQGRALGAVEELCGSYGFGALVVAGFAGTGKTSLIRVFSDQFGTPTVITPTGKSALRVREATGLNASTIHRWLYHAVEDEKTGVIKFVRRQPEDVVIPPSRMVVVDESSMLGPDIWKDVYGMCRLLSLKLVLVGDPFQLPPVQARDAAPFSVLLPEFATSIGATRVEMTEVLRQAQESPVIRASMALRNGAGLHALRELPRIESKDFWTSCASVFRSQGVIICHRNATRFTVNAGVRTTFGLTDEMPQPGEPMMVLKNDYGAGLMNGETFTFEGWVNDNVRPDVFERVYDPFKQVEAVTRFGGTTVNGGKTTVTLSLEELHGRLAEPGFSSIAKTAGKWARLQGLYSGDTLAPHVHANFGYCYTAHKSQGSEWPYVIVCLEPSVRLDEDDGRRWVYTGITRASKMAGIHLGRV